MRRVLRSLLVLSCGVVLAQVPLTTIDGGAFGYRLGYPSGWTLEREEDGSYVNVQPAAGQPGQGVVAIEFLVDPEVDVGLDAGVEEVLAELRANLLPDLNVRSRTPATVSGVPAVVVRLTGTVDGSIPVSYRLVVTLQGRTGYVLFLEALSEQLASYESLFDQVQASFVLTQTQAAPSPPVAPVSPLAPPAPTPTPAAGPGFAGTYAGDQLRLELEASPLAGGAFAGVLHHGDLRYPVTARLEGAVLTGEFESGGNRFAFTATLSGNVLTFVTGGATYTLARETPAPVEPVNPLGGPTPVVPQPTPPAPADVVASMTTTGEIGAVAPNGRARGRLDGVADDLSFHAYHVDVPAGTARLTIVLDADIDLDIAVKHGRPTERFSDKDRGGDWDYRDTGTQNPTTIAIDRPAEGRWFVDVLNILGAGQNGTYVLAFATGGSAGGPTPPPTPPEVVAGPTDSAFIGDLPPNGGARGRLDGVRDRVTYHTYVVQVPAGATRLTIELDADLDLDLAVKGGSEIQNYADKDQGGDWDFRDIGTQNPTVVVVERPAPGPWYVDVMNALGADRNGSYRLRVTTAGGF